MNMLEDCQRLTAGLVGYDLPVRIGFEATGNLARHKFRCSVTVAGLALGPCHEAAARERPSSRLISANRNGATCVAVAIRAEAKSCPAGH